MKIWILFLIFRRNKCIIKSKIISKSPGFQTGSTVVTVHRDSDKEWPESSAVPQVEEKSEKPPQVETTSNSKKDEDVDADVQLNLRKNSSKPPKGCCFVM